VDRHAEIVRQITGLTPDLPLTDGTVLLAPAICERALEDLPRTEAFRLRIGRARERIENDLDLEVFLRHTRLQPAGERVTALRSGTVEPLCDGTGPLSLGSHPALSWVEAVTVLDGRRYFLMKGHWYEFAIDYHEQVRAEVERILAAGAHDLDLPAWQPDMHEKDYNLHVAAVRPGYVCLDRKGVTTRLHRTHGVEICDLLGPDGELVHVKKAWGSAPLSHLFAQGMVSAQTLLHDSGARETFRALVRETTGGRVDHDGTPRKVVFAVLLRDGSSLDAEDLFPFSQVTPCAGPPWPWRAGSPWRSCRSAGPVSRGDEPQRLCAQEHHPGQPPRYQELIDVLASLFPTKDHSCSSKDGHDLLAVPGARAPAAGR
jgi:uncharacterized protein (TIGR04141 family)